MAYVLLILLLAGVAFAIWRAIHNSAANVRRRERRERRARYKAALARERADEETGKADR